MRFLKKTWPFILLFLLSLPAIRDLLRPGAYTSHDLTHHIVRIIQMTRLLKEGQIPPRWSRELNYGFGYPIFLFNYPLPHFLGALFYFLGFNFIWSAKLVFLVSMIFSCFFAFIFFRELWEDDFSGFISAIFYLYAPIRFVNVYVSATIGNALGFLFIPLIFWAILRLERKRGSILGNILIGSLNFSLLILSHNILTLMFAPLILCFFLLLFLKNRERAFLKKVFFMFVLGLGLACFFWLPALGEKKYIRYDNILPDFYKTYFPAFWQLIRSPWGYGFDHPGTINDAMPFQIGLTHILVIILSFLSFFFYFFKFKSFLGKRLSFLKKFFQTTHRAIKKNLKLAFFFFIFFFISIFLMQKVSIPVYDKISFLQYVQHPWRFLALSVFCASALAGYLVKILPGFWKAFCFLALLFLVLYSNRNHLRINQVFNPGEGYYLDIRGTTSMAGEHLPDWARQVDKEAEERIEVISGEAEIGKIRALSSKIEADIRVPQKAILKINHFYFPGWQLFINKNKKDFNYLVKGKDKKGLPIFTLEKGNYHLEYILEKTAIRSLADMISLVSIAAWVALGAVLLIRKNDFLG